MSPQSGALKVMKSTSRLAGPASRSITKAAVQMGFTLPRSVKAAALGVSLILSAFLTTAALRLPDQQWLAWISFLPLFVVVRSLRPSAAALAGGFWGGCLYLFCSAGPTSIVEATASTVEGMALAANTVAPAVDPAAPAIGASAWVLMLLILIPAVYVALAALPGRAIGFRLLTLALGWTLLEVVLVISYTNAPEPRAEWNPGLSGARAVSRNPEPRASARAVFQDQDYSHSLHQGLLTGSEGDGLHFHRFARLLGYVSTAFLVACANATLVNILSGARLSFPACRSLAGSPNASAGFPSQVVPSIQSWTLRQAHPRAPPPLVVG